MKSNRERVRAPIYSTGQYACVAIDSDTVRLDLETDDGSTVVVLITRAVGNRLTRDLARACTDTARME